MIQKPGSIDVNSSSTQALGPVVSVHRHPSASSILLVGFFGGVTLLFLCISISSMGQHLSIAAIAGVASLSLAAITALLIWFRRARRNDRFILHENGLGICKAGQETIVKWEEITNIKRGEINRGGGASIHTSPFLVLQTKRGQKLNVGGAWSSVNGNLIENGSKLVEVIEERTFSYRWKQCLADLERGAIVQFGKLSATRNGLTIKSKEYSWGDVEKISQHVTLINGQGTTEVELYIKGRQSPVQRLQLSQIVDYTILRGLHAAMARANPVGSL